MGPKRGVAFIKPDEPAFLKRIKQQVGYKESPNVDTKVCIFVLNVVPGCWDLFGCQVRFWMAIDETFVAFFMLLKSVNLKFVFCACCRVWLINL